LEEQRPLLVLGSWLSRPEEGVEHIDKAKLGFVYICHDSAMVGHERSVQLDETRWTRLKRADIQIAFNVSGVVVCQQATSLILTELNRGWTSIMGKWEMGNGVAAQSG
jgi:hypothetical protein